MLTVAVVTRDRTVLLRRAVRSYVSHARACGRDVRFLVVDGSESVAVRNENKKVVREAAHEYRVQVQYLSVREVETAVKRLSKRGVEEDTARFALLGSGTDASKGCLRNAAFLAASGDHLICVDDATCAKVVGPSGEASSVLFRSGALASDPTGAQAYESRSLSLLDDTFRSEDLFETLTRFLGRDASEIRTAESSWKGRNPTRGWVGVVQAGTIGGSTFGWGGYPLLYQGASTAGFRSSYPYARDGKAFLRAVRCPQIGSYSFVLSQIVALDASRPLAPFVPVGVAPQAWGGADVFGILYRRFFASGLVGFVPSAVYYNPIAQGALDLSAPPVVFQDVLVQALRPDETFEGSPPEVLGGRLRTAAALEGEDFTQALVDGAASRREALVSRIQRAVAHSKAPAAWQADMGTLLDACEADDSYLPSDLAGTEAEVVARTKILLDQCGRLIEEWTTLVQGARELRSSGKEMAITL